jgi:PAB-dependent poly(A)-specific ribonuclease subunit 3
VKNVEQGLQLLQQNYSSEFVQIVARLVSGNSHISEISRALADRVMDEYDIALDTSDGLQSHLREEYENGRLFRLAMKLGFVNERFHVDNSNEWSECGDRYILKLFRDYVFHQNDDGVPILDAGHVISSLNKLDVGDQEQILLCSRDQKDLLIVSFRDIRR